MLAHLVLVALSMFQPTAPAHESIRLCWLAVYQVVAPDQILTIGSGPDAYQVASDESPEADMLGSVLCE